MCEGPHAVFVRKMPIGLKREMVSSERGKSREKKRKEREKDQSPRRLEGSITRSGRVGESEDLGRVFDGDEVEGEASGRFFWAWDAARVKDVAYDDLRIEAFDRCVRS
jgi:hypothetical protein